MQFQYIRVTLLEMFSGMLHLLLWDFVICEVRTNHRRLQVGLGHTDSAAIRVPSQLRASS